MFRYLKNAFSDRSTLHAAHPYLNMTAPPVIVAWKDLNFLAGQSTNQQGAEESGQARRIVLKSDPYGAAPLRQMGGNTDCGTDLIRRRRLKRVRSASGLATADAPAKLKAHLGELNGYKSNQHRISDQQRAAVSRRWGWYMDRFGYRAPVRAQTAKSQEKRHSGRELIPA
jgi:hypothetical protein